MEKSKLTPFDAETILMIKSFLGIEPRVIEYETEYCIMIPWLKCTNVLETAIAGRLGERLKTKEEDEVNVFFRVKYQNNAEFMPTEVRTDLEQPNKNAGYVYCRRLLEVRALPVKRDNLEKLQMFTGGGTMQIPRTPGGLAVYSFPTENGVLLDVPEYWYIVRYPDGRFAKMERKDFEAEFEPKCTSKQSISAPGKNDVYCGNCAAFKCEDMKGDGYCETCDTMRHCGDLACHEWQSKAENQQYKHFEERFNNKQ